MINKTIVLSSGGTGGHVFPAMSLAEALEKRGYRIIMITDQRGKVFQDCHNIADVVIYPISKGTGRFGIASKIYSLLRATIKSWFYLRRLKPLAVVGFGGYPSAPAVLSAQFLGLPTLIHEQNAVMGRTNRFIAKKSDRIATAFPTVSYLPENKTIVLTGNPVRRSIIAAAQTPYTIPGTIPGSGDKIHLFVVGGSQGAAVFSRVLPKALKLLPPEMLQKIEIVQQCRRELVEETGLAYEAIGCVATVAPFFDDMDQQLAKAHLVIARSGALTVAELSVMGRPAIFVPYPSAMDDHQTSNAKVIRDAGGAWLIPEKLLTPELLNLQLREIFAHPHILTERAEKMRELAIPDAAEKLADALENLLLK